MVEILLILLAIVVLCINSFVIYNLYRKLLLVTRRYEELLEWYTFFRAKIEDSNERLGYIDKKGGFASDDEIGFFFKEVKDIAEDLKNVVDIVEDDEDLKVTEVNNLNKGKL
jgi:hypothetical protein